MQRALRRSSLVPAGFVVESAFCDAGRTIITVRHSQSFGLCPSCGSVSRRVHSRYRRRVRDLPLSGGRVELVVIARSFLDAVRKSMRQVRSVIGATQINPELLAWMGLHKDRGCPSLC